MSDRKIILFIRKQDLYSSDICLYCNEAMSDISDAEFYCLITKVYKPPKNFDFPETERSFLFVWFEEFPWVYYSRWEDGAYCLPCILFGHEVVWSSSLENLYRKPCRTWPTAVEKNKKTFKKTLKCSNGDTQKESNITY